MKRKNDFVTNSSSCSFIFIGWVIDNTRENIFDLADTFNIQYEETSDNDSIISELNSSAGLGIDICVGYGDDGLKEDKIYIGTQYRLSDDEEDYNELSIHDFISNNEKILDKFKQSDIKIIPGTMLC